MPKTLLCVVLAIVSGGCSGVGSVGKDAGIGLDCCPAEFDLYSCQHKNGSSGLACHNPAMGCASSLMCGQGCDPEVSGRCQCVQNVLCIVGDHFDRDLCKCVPDSGASSCVAAVDCKGVLPALCQQCADGGTACAHFVCASGTCQVAVCE